MSNPLTGEAARTIGGVRYALVYSIDALIALEDDLGQSVAEIALTLGDMPRLGVLRKILFHGLRTRHSGELTEVAAGELIGALGVIPASEWIGEAFRAAFRTEGGGKGQKRPRKASPAGTGAPATEPGESST